MTPAQFELTRRRLLQGAAVMAASSILSGCGLCKPRPIVPCATAPTVSGPLLTIDSHCHIFNGSDLDVKDFFDKIVWNEKGILGAVSKAVGAILEDLVWDGAPSGDGELAMLRAFDACPDEAQRQKIMTGHREKRYRAGRGALLNTRAMKAVPRRRAQNRPELIGPGILSSDSVLDQMYDSLQPKTHAEYKSRAMTRAALVAPQATSAAEAAKISISGALDYVLENFQYRFGAMQDYLNTFTETNGRGIDLMLASMVDYDWWLSKGCRPETPLPRQVEVMARISIVSHGQVHGFVPFDPLREVAFRAGKQPEQDCKRTPVPFSSLDLVKDAVENQGCLGVKLYPPMGFAAYGNAGQPAELWRQKWLPGWTTEMLPSTKDNLRLPLGQRLDEVLAEFYTWCCGNDVPVMAHSNASNGAIQEFRDLAAPKYWKMALTDPRWHNLRISFGHLGGFSDEADTSEFASQFIALMSDETNAAGSHAFADAAYFSEVLSGTGHLKDKILEAYRTTGQKPPVLPRRLLYGTDWNLLMNAGAVKPYFADFISIFNEADAVSAHASERFFGYNAVEWIGLRKKMPARNRLEAFYKKQRLDFERNPPGWMKKVDGE